MVMQIFADMHCYFSRATRIIPGLRIVITARLWKVSARLVLVLSRLHKTQQARIQGSALQLARCSGHLVVTPCGGIPTLDYNRPRSDLLMFERLLIWTKR